MNKPTDWTEGNVDLGDGAIHYYRAGVRGGPAIVLAHGFSDQGLCWIPTANALAAAHDVVMTDARGHGHSARLVKSNSYDIVEDQLRVISALKLDKPIVFGHSMGAQQSAVLAARHPDAVRALVLIDPPWFDMSEGAAFAMRLDGDNPNWQWVKAIPNKTLDDYMAETRAQYPQWSDVIVEAWCEGKKLLDQNVLGTTLLPAANTRSIVQAIRCPTLLLTADPELGGIVTPALADEIAQLNSHFTVARIRNAGHHLNFTQPETYWNAVQSFLSSL